MMLIFKLIKNINGETIAETLVSTLIASLAMVMFASMIIASKNIIENSNKKIVEYYEGFSEISTKTTADSQNMGPITIYINKSGIMYYDYN